MKKWTPKVYKGQLCQPTFFDLTQWAKLLTRAEKDKIADLEFRATDYGLKWPNCYSQNMELSQMTTSDTKS